MSHDRAAKAAAARRDILAYLEKESGEGRDRSEPRFVAQASED